MTFCWTAMELQEYSYFGEFSTEHSFSPHFSTSKLEALTVFLMNWRF